MRCIQCETQMNYVDARLDKCNQLVKLDNPYHVCPKCGLEQGIEGIDVFLKRSFFKHLNCEYNHAPDINKVVDELSDELKRRFSWLN